MLVYSVTVYNRKKLTETVSNIDGKAGKHLPSKQVVSTSSVNKK